MSEFKGARQSSEIEATKATARLPGLEIEIVHGFSPDGGAERIAIHLQAQPSFEAFGQFLDAANPLAFWAEAARLAWLPWLNAAHAMMLPWNLAPLLPDPEGVAHSSEEPHSSR